MTYNTNGLKKYAEEKTKLTLDKVDKGIRELSLNGEKINFNSVMVASGVSKAFLYNNKEIKERIESLRQKQINKQINQRAKHDKTARSKDIIIIAKDKKIKELEHENKELKNRLEKLRSKVYEEL